ncbi:uncharacterized protein METZ01_LOCUS283825 [marine metagenome]|uniref:Uncharacterized protein n=1 Tax=marine metagenome TaxID=408172 RepID=A0A382L7V2_9ZZZZ
MKYLKSKTDSIEESILQMWEKAAKQAEDNTNDKSDDGKGLDKVKPKALKKKFKDRKDKDIDNDGDVDASDKYLHKRRKAVSKAISKEDMAGSVKREASVTAATGDDEMAKKRRHDYEMKWGRKKALTRPTLTKPRKPAASENYDVGTPENTKAKLEATPGQSEEEWEEQVETIQKKNSSMRERLAQIWGMDEGSNPFAPQKKKEEKTPKKTMTGEPVTKVKVDPKIDDR